MRRFARLANAFSKKLENHAAAVAMFAAYYNFVWRTRYPDHSGKPGKLPPTATMMAKVVPDLWSFDSTAQCSDSVRVEDESAMRITALALTVLVSLASGCKDSSPASRQTTPAPTSIDDLYRIAEKLEGSGRHSDITLLLRGADADLLLETEIRGRDSPRYLCIAEEALFIPGVPHDAELQILQNRSFIEIPGLGDDSAVAYADRDALFDAAYKLATPYNRQLFERLQRDEAKSPGPAVSPK